MNDEPRQPRRGRPRRRPDGGARRHGGSRGGSFQRRRDYGPGYSSVYAGPYPQAHDEPALTLAELQEKSIDELRELATEYGIEADGLEHSDLVLKLLDAVPLAQASRREEIERFLSGAADVCVATDVLGHGVNLPCETLLFAETNKFDGEERRNLLPWELAQIAGRAGRFGLVERGHVGVLAGLGWGTADPDLVEDALEPHVRLPGGHWGYRVVDEARIRPRLSDLGIDDPADLDAALVAWHRIAVREWAFESWLAVESLQPIRLRLDAVRRRLAERGRRISLDDTWTLVNSPVDEDGLELLGTFALALSGDRVARPHLTFVLDESRLRTATLEEAERIGREASILRWFALQYPGVGGVTMERAAALEEAAAARVVARLRVEVESPTIGRCRSCGRSCAPWFPLCDRCAGLRRRS